MGVETNINDRMRYRIGLDFDGVIVDVDLNTEYWSNSVDKLRPISAGVTNLLNDNVVCIILTGRKNLVEVLEWLVVNASDYKGEVASAVPFGGSKGMYCKWRNIDVFVDDTDFWVEDVNSWGIDVLKFDKNKHKCPKQLLISEGYING